MVECAGLTGSETQHPPWSLPAWVSLAHHRDDSGSDFIQAAWCLCPRHKPVDVCWRSPWADADPGREWHPFSLWPLWPKQLKCCGFWRTHCLPVDRAENPEPCPLPWKNFLAPQLYGRAGIREPAWEDRSQRRAPWEAPGKPPWAWASARRSWDCRRQLYLFKVDFYFCTIQLVMSPGCDFAREDENDRSVDVAFWSRPILA